MSLYTIGHSTHKIEYFVRLLKANNIGILADVRGVPYSKFSPAYNRDVLEKPLAGAGIQYLFMGGCLGAKTADINLYDDTGCMDFEKMSQTRGFIEGTAEVKRLLGAGFNIALMCVEKDPIDCHRAILVSRALALSGISAAHILPGGQIQTQAELDTRLLDKYFPNRAQLSFFDGPTREERLKAAYRRRNRDIGYYIENFCKKKIKFLQGYSLRFRINIKRT